VNLVERGPVVVRAGHVDHHAFLAQRQLGHRRAEHRLARARRPDQQQLAERREVQLLVDQHPVLEERLHIRVQIFLQVGGQDHLVPVHRGLEIGVRAADDVHILAAAGAADHIVAQRLEIHPGVEMLGWDQRDRHNVGIVVAVVGADVQHLERAVGVVERKGERADRLAQHRRATRHHVLADRDHLVAVHLLHAGIIGFTLQAAARLDAILGKLVAAAFCSPQ